MEFNTVKQVAGAGHSSNRSIFPGPATWSHAIPGYDAFAGCLKRPGLALSLLLLQAGKSPSPQQHGADCSSAPPAALWSWAHSQA